MRDRQRARKREKKESESVCVCERERERKRKGLAGWPLKEETQSVEEPRESPERSQQGTRGYETIQGCLPYENALP